MYDFLLAINSNVVVIVVPSSTMRQAQARKDDVAVSLHDHSRPMNHMLELALGQRNSVKL